MKKIILLIPFIFISCSHVFYQPAGQQYYSPEKFQVKYEEHRYKTSDGIELHSWLLKPEKGKPKGTFLYFHGNAENISTHFLGLAWLTLQGYQVLIFDYRGYWKSEGKPSQKGTLKDSLASFDYALKIHEQTGSKNLYLYCQSLGGIICGHAFPKWKDNKKVKMLVFDSTFNSYQDIAFDKLKSNFLSFILSPLAYVLVSDWGASKNVLKEIKVPTLVVHGFKDRIIPAENGRKIYDLLETDKYFWKLKNTRHIQTFKYLKERNNFMKILKHVESGKELKSLNL